MHTRTDKKHGDVVVGSTAFLGSVSLQFRASNSRRIWIGKWWKPWTWARRGTRIEDAELLSMDILPNIAMSHGEDGGSSSPSESSPLAL